MALNAAYTYLISFDSGILLITECIIDFLTVLADKAEVRMHWEERTFYSIHTNL